MSNPICPRPGCGRAIYQGGPDIGKCPATEDQHRISELEATVAQLQSKCCVWMNEDDEGPWQGACSRDAAFCFNDGGPVENKFNFCPYCGGKIIIPSEDFDA